MKTKTLIVLLFASLVTTVFSTAWAKDEYPNRQIQLICPYAVGGITDLSARIIAEKMGYKIDFMNGRNTQGFLEAETKKWSSVVKQASIMIK